MQHRQASGDAARDMPAMAQWVVPEAAEVWACDEKAKRDGLRHGQTRLNFTPAARDDLSIFTMRPAFLAGIPPKPRGVREEAGSGRID